MPDSFSQQIDTATDHRQAADRLAAHVILRAEEAGFRISTAVRRDAMALLRRLSKSNLSPHQMLGEFVRGFRSILHEHEPALAAVATDAILASWLEGGSSVVKQLPSGILVPDGPTPTWVQTAAKQPRRKFAIIEEAATDLARRKVLTASDYYAANDMARARAFTVSRVAALDSIEKIRDKLVEAVIDGKPVREFRQDVDSALGGSGLAPSHLELVFRNAVMNGYARGQKKIVEHPLVRSIAVFVDRSEINDSRLTDICKLFSHSGIEGTSIYFVRDPVWKIVANPSHHCCRCTAIYLSVKHAAEKGLAVAKRWLATGIQPPDSELFVPMPNLSTIPIAEQRAFAAWQSPWQI